MVAVFFTGPHCAWAGTEVSRSANLKIAKTATNLDENYESSVTLHFEDFESAREVVYVIDASSRDFLNEADSALDQFISEHADDGEKARIGIVLFGAEGHKPAEVALPLTELTQQNASDIKAAFSKVKSAQPGIANGEAALDLADKMLNDALKEHDGSGMYQSMVFVSDGEFTSWGTVESSEWGTGESSETFFYDNESTTAPEEVFDARKNAGKIDSLIGKNGSIKNWVNTEGESIEDAITSYGTVSFDEEKVVSADKASDVPTSLEAGLYRFAKRWIDLLKEGEPAVNRYTHVVHDGRRTTFPNDCPVSSWIQANFMQDTNSLSWWTINYYKNSTLGDISDAFAVSLDESMGTVSGIGIEDAMGYGAYDETDSSDTYAFSLVDAPGTMSLVVDGKRYGVVAERSFTDEGSDATGYVFGTADEKGKPVYVAATLLYFPEGKESVPESLKGYEGEYTLPSDLVEGGTVQDDDERFVLEFQNSPSFLTVPTVDFTYRVRLDQDCVKSDAGIYGAYDEDGSEHHEGLFTNKAAYIATGINNIQEFPRPTVSYSINTVKVRPADITVYMCGNGGYEGVITGEGEGEYAKSDSLPEPGFYFELPNDINKALADAGVTVAGEAADLSKYMRIYTSGYTVDGEEEKLNWKLEKYGDTHSGAYDRFIYRIVPAPEEGQESVPVRLQFTSDDGKQTFTSSTFEPSKIGALYEKYTMKLYTELVKNNQVVFEVDTNGFEEDGGTVFHCGMELIDGTLTVRYVTGGEGQVVTGIATTDAELAEAVRNNPDCAYAQHSADAKFFINGSDVDVTDDAAPSLLFDDVVNDGNTEGASSYDEQLRDEAISKIENELDIDLEIDGYEAKYLDLVDANNANVWLRANEPTTVYWPYPAGTDRDTEFHLVHFKGLNREIDNGDIASSIANADTEVLRVENTSYGIKFTTDGFSPFVLVWEDADDPWWPVTPDPGPDPSDPSKPDTDIDKELTGRDLVAGEFSFRISVAGSNASHVSPKSLTGTNDAEGNVTFQGKGFTFDKVGTYTFEVSEVVPADDDPSAEGIQHEGVTYDETTYTVTAKVTKGADGKLAVSWQSPGRAVSFRNAYEPSGGAETSIGAMKVLEGRELAAGEFAFELRDADGNLVATATNAADGSVSFAPVQLDGPGTYTYYVSEIAGDLEGITYDASVHEVIVTVADAGDGTLTATVTYDGGEALPVFTNTYAEPEEPSEPGEPEEPGKPADPGEPSQPADPTEPGKAIPQTGDPSALIGLVAVAGAVLVGGGIVLRKRKS